MVTHLKTSQCLLTDFSMSYITSQFSISVAIILYVMNVNHCPPFLSSMSLLLKTGGEYGIRNRIMSMNKKQYVASSSISYCLPYRCLFRSQYSLDINLLKRRCGTSRSHFKQTHWWVEQKIIFQLQFFKNHPCQNKKKNYYIATFFPKTQINTFIWWNTRNSRNTRIAPFKLLPS